MHPHRTASRASSFSCTSPLCAPPAFPFLSPAISLLNSYRTSSPRLVFSFNTLPPLLSLLALQQISLPSLSPVFHASQSSYQPSGCGLVHCCYLSSHFASPYRFFGILHILYVPVRGFFSFASFFLLLDTSSPHHIPMSS